ncbi:hypothetical protein BaRGS_00021525 [Batillaria attramentaria]|uniref:RING-type domain-containing protein n=1 Tax=Batillaria attramentaria TaxID=370345 RepID=A0ABD0KJU3_9CAEN
MPGNQIYDSFSGVMDASDKEERDLFVTIMEDINDVMEKCRPFSHSQQRRKPRLQTSKVKHMPSKLNKRHQKTLYSQLRQQKMRPLLHDFDCEYDDFAYECDYYSTFSFSPDCQSVCMESPQNLKHSLNEDNVPSEVPTDVISFLINLQHREMTPEDYDMLLRLDEGIAPKTVQADVLGNLKTDIIRVVTADGEECASCAVCMEQYEVGQSRKFLPCGHVFHVQCIDTWLLNSSQNCPLDGLPVDPAAEASPDDSVDEGRTSLAALPRMGLCRS